MVADFESLEAALLEQFSEIACVLAGFSGVPSTLFMLLFRLKVTPMPRILVINPGSTSTKISVFDDMKCLFTESVFHDAPQLLSFPTANDQVPFRMKVVEDLLEKYGVPFESIDVYVGRGGCAYSQKAGVMEIDERLVRDTAEDKGGSDHPAEKRCSP